MSKVGVFVDENREKVLRIAEMCGLDVLQFHGKESPLYCRSFPQKYKVIKTFFPHERPFKEKMKKFTVDAFLFDIQFEQKLKGDKSLSKEVLSEIKKLIKSLVR